MDNFENSADRPSYPIDREGVQLDMDIFGNLLVSRMPKLQRYARMLAKDANKADDLVQETLLKAWSNRHKFETGTNLDAWLNTILRNSFFSQYRRARLIDVDSDSVALTMANHPAEQEATIAFRECGEDIEQLPAHQREALLMVTVAGASYEEAAKHFGCSTGTIKSRINRARNRLSAMAEAAGSEHILVSRPNEKQRKFAAPSECSHHPAGWIYDQAKEMSRDAAKS